MLEGYLSGENRCRSVLCKIRYSIYLSDMAMKPKVGIVHILGKYGMHAMNAEYEIFFFNHNEHCRAP